MKEDITTLTREEIKLTIDLSLAEQEKRITKELRVELNDQTKKLTDAIDKQNLLYSTQIIQLNKDVTALESRVSNMRTQIAVVGSVCTALGGLIGFFIAQLVH